PEPPGRVAQPARVERHGVHGDGEAAPAVAVLGRRRGRCHRGRDDPEGREGEQTASGAHHHLRIGTSVVRGTSYAVRPYRRKALSSGLVARAGRLRGSGSGGQAVRRSGGQAAPAVRWPVATAGQVPIVASHATRASQTAASWPLRSCAPGSSTRVTGPGITAVCSASSAGVANGSVRPDTNRTGARRSGRCSVRSRSGLPGGCRG